MIRNTLRIGIIFGSLAVMGSMLIASPSKSDDSIRSGPPSFEIVNSTIDGGGGASAGGTYVLSGTIGQPDAGVMTGGAFELQSGFWQGGIDNNCPADLANSDGLINVFDLFVLLSNWSTNGPGAELAPNESIVDVFDLFVLLSAWGACP